MFSARASPAMHLPIRGSSNELTHQPHCGDARQVAHVVKALQTGQVVVTREYGKLQPVMG